MTKQKKLVGGFNLFDSVGLAAHQVSQHEQLVNELDENARLNWQQADSQNHNYRFDLTFRQDDDTEIAIMDKNIKGGALPEYPIRRFFTRHYEEDKKVSFLNPITPSTAKSWEEYNNALNAVETALDGSAFSVKNTLYTDGDLSLIHI